MLGLLTSESGEAKSLLVLHFSDRFLDVVLSGELGRVPLRTIDKRAILFLDFDKLHLRVDHEFLVLASHILWVSLVTGMPAKRLLAAFVCIDLLVGKWALVFIAHDAFGSHGRVEAAEDSEEWLRGLHLLVAGLDGNARSSLEIAEGLEFRGGVVALGCSPWRRLVLDNDCGLLTLLPAQRSDKFMLVFGIK